MAMLCETGRSDEQPAVNVGSDEVPYAVMTVEPYDQPVISEYATSYSQREFPARLLPPIPSVSHSPASNHTENGHTATQINPGFLSNAGSSLAERKEDTSYAGLESSTRETAPAPAAYDSLVKPVYVNDSTAANELQWVMGDVIYHKQQSDPDTSSYLSPVSPHYYLTLYSACSPTEQM